MNSRRSSPLPVTKILFQAATAKKHYFNEQTINIAVKQIKNCDCFILLRGFAGRNFPHASYTAFEDIFQIWFPYCSRAESAPQQ